ncbi:hypothetical protein P7K49_020167 [Saguinus oedipus]|uniref:Uncharacterized protein n=1 Tax=Saguinus oedipus TaxID=9490 RepID=A0ABQ9UZL2_SAGOE|nr:hypothetical protein P7K49_020167 [Saguinus oedipus]
MTGKVGFQLSANALETQWRCRQCHVRGRLILEPVSSLLVSISMSCYYANPSTAQLSQENRNLGAKVRVCVRATWPSLCRLDQFCEAGSLATTLLGISSQPAQGGSEQDLVVTLKLCSPSPGDGCHSIQVELEAEAEKMQVSQQELLSVDESVYTPDSDVAEPQINRNLIQKAGYLNLRNSRSWFSSWYVAAVGKSALGLLSPLEAEPMMSRIIPAKLYPSAALPT